MAIAANSLRSSGQGRGSPERASLLRWPRGAAQNPAPPSSYPWPPAAKAAAIETPGVHTGLKSNTRAGRGPSRDPPACCLGHHGNEPRGGGERRARRGDTHSIAGLREAGRAAAGLSALLASAGAEREVEPESCALPARTLLPWRVQSERSGFLGSQPANKTGSNWIMLFAGR